MARKPKAGDEQLPLAPAEAPPDVQTPAPGAVASALVEYSVAGETWRCNRLDLLSAEVGQVIAVGQLAPLQLMLQSKERTWLIARRLFGLQPQLPPPSYNLDDLRLWSPDELREALGMTRPQLQAELDQIRGAWKALVPEHRTPNAEHRTPKEKAEEKPKEDFLFRDKALLEQYGFDLKFKNQFEANWFVERLRDYEPLLREKRVAFLARNALRTELHISRLDKDLDERDVTGTEYKSNLKLRGELDKTYREQTEQLEELAPWAGGLLGKYTFMGVLSDITKAIRAYQSGDTKLVDGMFSAMEIQVECRRSVQSPDPRYRAGLVMYVSAAREGLWNPNWRSPFAPAQLKKLDKAWQAALVAAGVEEGETVPDLEAEGVQGEYPAITKVDITSNAEHRTPNAELPEGK